MLACDRPQYSAHWPQKVLPASSRSVLICMWLRRPGTASSLPASFGGQNEWMTSADVRRTSIVLPAGMCSSLAVTMPGVGVVVLPPPLVTGHGDLHHVGTLRDAVEADDVRHGEDADDEQDQRGADRPADLHRRVAVDLLRRVVVAAAPVLITTTSTSASTRTKTTIAMAKTGSHSLSSCGRSAPSGRARSAAAPRCRSCSGTAPPAISTRRELPQPPKAGERTHVVGLLLQPAVTRSSPTIAGWKSHTYRYVPALGRFELVLRARRARSACR